ncbi:M48 family metalloprotease [filamentous cyanobacterium LEGE 11480]|uniref:Protease HtpX homolog n=1 Tax=Romeriopsis navalis LEGE 11480 TaxID=2777977 RepID=A0A928Z493_9CYAN|nr:M48 family metalloprotease [Romeriopsis navalis]MBE9030093.1 M48 family metalloprotease [Romeriopsis navalis LEGE 11480]
MNQFKTVALLGLLSGLLVLISYEVFGGIGGASTGLLLAALMNMGSWYFSDKIALSAYRAKPLEADQAPALYQMVQRLSEKADIPMPAIYLVPGQAANAFATGRDPEHAAVAVTEGILSMLPEDELEGVIAHELSHVLSRDTLTQAVAATIGGAISWLGEMVFWFGMGNRDDNEGGNPIGLLLTMFLAPVSATIIQMGLSRTREFAADASAARLTGKPMALANALRRLETSAQTMPMQGNPAFSPLLIVNPPMGKQLMNLFATHPPTEARIEKLDEIAQELSGTKVPDALEA